MDNIEVSELEFKRAILIALIKDFLDQNINFSIIRDILIKNITTQIKNVLEKKQDTIVNAIEFNKNLGITSFVQEVGNEPSVNNNKNIVTPQGDTLKLNKLTKSQNIPPNVRITSQNILKNIEELRTKSSKFVDTYYFFTKYLQTQDTLTLQAYSKVFDDILQRLDMFITHFNNENQNYLSRQFFTNLCIKIITDKPVDNEDHRKMIREIVNSAEKLVIEKFEQNNQISHTREIEENLELRKYDVSNVKIYLVMVKNFARYLELHSNNLDNYKIAISQIKKYLYSTKESLNIFSSLSTLITRD